jgi:hypothetical protein
MSKGPRLSAHEIDTIRGLLIDGHTVTQAQRLTCFSRGAIENVAAKMRAEGLRVMRSPQGRKRQLAA